MLKFRFLLPALLGFGFAMLATDPVPAPSTVSTPTAPPSTVSTAAPAPAGPRITYSSAHVDGPYIAMTFDDGPSAANTPRLLDLLAKRHIKATFFVLGENVQQNTDLLKRIVAEGHEVGNHSWSHPVLASLSDDKIRSELQRTDDIIFKTAGIHPTLMRPPYGALARGQRVWVNKEFGYKIILWEVDPLDWKYRNAAHVENAILNGDKDGPGARPGSIILSHDIHATTVDAMPSTLDQLLAKGYKFVTVSQLIAMDKPLPPKPSPGPVKKDAAAPQATASPAAAASATPAAATR